MRENGIDPQERAANTKVNYDIPDLMQIKPKTPGAQVAMMELLGIKPEIEVIQEVKPLTKQKPFDFKTAKRVRRSSNDENEFVEINSDVSSDRPD